MRIRFVRAAVVAAGVAAAVWSGTVLIDAQVPYQRLLRAASEPQNWLTYGGSYKSQRYSALDQINRQTVARLKVAWAYQMRPGVVETSPLVADGIMYITEPPSTVTALDVRSGRPIWTYTPAIPPDVIIIGSPPVNRGVGILDDTVFLGTVHGHLIALDARSGGVRWDVTVQDNKSGYYLTLSPLALDGKIIVGVSGAETGIRGFIDAYDAKSGKLLWRTYTIPAPGEPGFETWGKGNGWQTGGGSTWLTGSYDPDLKLLYWTTGNPAPDWNADNRPGDNLYTDAVLALDPDTGKLRWHFQFTPEDVHDWDSNQTVILFEATVGGRERKLLGQANRNGFYYVLDRETGAFITGVPYAKQTWADGLDAKGRPIRKKGIAPSPEGTLVFPNIQGAANWYSPSYSPQTKLFYQHAREMGTIYYKGDAVYKPGTAFTGGGGRYVNGDDASGAIRALDAVTGKLKWEFPLLSPGWTSLLSTAGGLVFGGTEEGNFVALDAETGKPVWDLQLGGTVRGIPISYAVDGKQYVAIAAGNALFAFALP
ncbi:MAG TPA: PQQ-dependent dehydrogenase, methanol/ethanol family [Vicinamibacterales bacterium]|jgi:alcohol dehydrogenase (cytochrome c)|nr:PQQ-dependent dehydrogenase, methanol/ethanol family [Vicinamibacterales bacterium]